MSSNPRQANAVPSHTWVRRVSGWWLGYCVVVGVVRRNQLLRVEDGPCLLACYAASVWGRSRGVSLALVGGAAYWSYARNFVLQASSPANVSTRRPTGRPDPRPDVRENVKLLGDLASDFDFTQTPRPPTILPIHPRTTLTH
jgi:hypothetical protein